MFPKYRPIHHYFIRNSSMICEDWLLSDLCCSRWCHCRPGLQHRCQIGTWKFPSQFCQAQKQDGFCISGVQLSSSHVAYPNEKGNHVLTIRTDILTSMPPLMQRFITIVSWMGVSFSVSWIGSDYESHKVYVPVNPPYNWDFKLSAMKNMLHKHTLSDFPFRRSTCNPHDNSRKTWGKQFEKFCW